MKTELLYLLLTAILTGVLWIPVVIGYVTSRGVLTPSSYKTAPTSPLPDWVNRANRAHLNAVENFAPFAAVVLIAQATGTSSPVTVVCAAVYFYARAAHAVIHGPMVLNDAGRAVVQAFREAERAYDALQQSWAGAYLAGLFLRNPWLQSARITLTASAEYNDQGGTYRSVSASVTQALPVPGLVLPASLVCEGSFNEIGAIALIEDDLGDSDYDLYTAFNPAPNDYGDLVLDVNRSAIAHLLNGDQVSGGAAYLALFLPATSNVVST
jgi:uncharacterized MAPEG superfamily protein